MAAKLSDREIQISVASLPGWSLKDGKLYREHQLANSEQTFTFMTHVNRLAQMMNHHLEMINAYNMVRMSLSTRTVRGITQLDVELAKKINEIVSHQANDAQSPSVEISLTQRHQTYR